MARKTKAPAPNDDLTLSLSGSLGSSLYLIRASSMQLVTTFAFDKDATEHLLPLADWQMVGKDVGSGEDLATSFKSLLPLENMAFLIADMTKEFSSLISKLEQLSKVSCMDVKSVARWMEEASASAQEAAKTAERLVNSTEF
jgi:hypothetical protein